MPAFAMNSAALAIEGGAPAVNLPCPTWPIAGDLEAAWMEGVVRSGQWSWLGPHERAFLEEFRAFIGCRYAAGLANGTVTLQCALQAVGVEPGDEVIVPGLTWVATAQAALDVGANVVFADIDPATLCLDPASFEKSITRRTKAVIPVHLYGCMCDMDAILKIAKSRGLKVVEDVAHQHGSRWKNRGAGALGDAGSFSFQQSKVLTCGEGGAVTTDCEDVFRKVFALKHVGWTPEFRPAQMYGHNYRMTEMQAVLLRGGLRRIEEQTRVREENAARIAAALDKMGGPLRAVPRDPRVTRQAYYAMTLFFDASKADGLCKHAYMFALNAEKCPITGTYWPVYRAPILNLYDATSPIPCRRPAPRQNYRILRLPNTERAVDDTALLIPQTHLLGSDAYIGQMLAAIEKVNSQARRVRRTWEKHLSIHPEAACCHMADRKGKKSRA